MSQGFTKQVAPIGFIGLAPLLVTLPNAKFINGFVGNAGTGDIDLYTVPAGRRAIVYMLEAFGDSFNYFAEIKISGTYFQLGFVGGVSFAASSVTVPLYAAEAGETFAANIDTSGGNVWLRGIEFDAAVLKTSKLITLSIGDNTLYTAPSSGSALVLTSDNLSVGGVADSNQSGGDANRIHYLVPNGGSPGTDNQFAAYLAADAATIDTTLAPTALNANDSIVINGDRAGAQFCFVTVIELGA